MQNIKGILFDMDGVLADSEPVILKAAILALKEYGVNAEKKDFIPFIGAGEDKFVGGVAEFHNVKYKKEMKERAYDIFDEIVESELVKYEKIPETLNTLKRSGNKLALCTSADLRKVKSLLPVIGLPFTIFDIILSGNDIKNKKPDPEIFNTACMKLNLKNENCVVIEDAINGIKAAKAAKCKVIAVTTSFKEEVLKNYNPDAIVDKTFKIIDYINK